MGKISAPTKRGAKRSHLWGKPKTNHSFPLSKNIQLYNNLRQPI